MRLGKALPRSRQGPLQRNGGFTMTANAAKLALVDGPTASDLTPAEQESPSPPYPGSETVLGRLLSHGPETLSDRELLAVLLGDDQGAGVLLERHGVLGTLVGIQAPDLQHLGLSAEATGRLRAAIDLAARLARARIENRPLIDHPGKVASYLTLRYLDPQQERMGALFLDQKNHVLGESLLFQGTPSRAAVDPGIPLREALLAGARALILFHNHPSQDPSPSPQDLRFTKRVAQGAETLGLRLLDHVILGSLGRWVSLRRRGAW